MLDQFGRNIRYLRVSVTDRCNLRCRYCMPEEGVEWVDHSAILTYEQIIRLVRLAASLGVEKVRLTGGEPLVRKGLANLVQELKAIDGIRTVSLTTNGILLADQLPELLKAGLDGVNLSLDTLDRAQFAALTRRDELPRALAGLEAALAKDRDLTVRFIELMPIGLGDTLTRRTEEEVLRQLETAFGLALPCPSDALGGPSRNVTFPGFQGKVGFISAVSHQFCQSCNRVRLTATGFLKTCLQYDHGVDLKALLDAGADDTALQTAMADAINHKPASHHFGGQREAADEGRNMNQIGG